VPDYGNLTGVVRHCSSKLTRKVFASLVLGLLLLRAYVPTGFMPASGQPFLLELCPAAGPMPMIDARDDMAGMDVTGMNMAAMPGMAMAGMPAHHHHQSGSHGDHAGTHAGFDTCPFGSAPAAGPLSTFDFFQPATVDRPECTSVPDSPRFAARCARAHRPRGPPALA
jgi:hypothetical protein